MKKVIWFVLIVSTLTVAILKSSIDEYMNFLTMERHREKVNVVVIQALSEINVLFHESQKNIECIKKDIRHFSEFAFREYLPFAGKKYDGSRLIDGFKLTLQGLDRIRKKVESRLCEISGNVSGYNKSIAQNKTDSNVFRNLQNVIDCLTFQKSFNINAKRTILIVDLVSGLPVIKSIAAVIASDVSLDFWLEHQLECSFQTIDSLHIDLFARMKRQITAEGYRAVQQIQFREINSRLYNMKIG